MTPPGLVIFIFLLGALFLARLSRSLALPSSWLFYLVWSPSAGLALVSICLFLGYVLGQAEGPFISLLLSWVLFLYLAAAWITQSFSRPSFSFSFLQLRSQITNVFSPAGKSWKDSASHLLTLFLSLLFAYGLWKLIVLHMAGSIWNPFGGWDTKYIWHVKAKFFFRSPEEWKNMFSPLISWTHGDYPLMVPAAIAWGWSWTGRELLIWPCLVSFFFALSGPLFLLWHFRVSGSTRTGLLAATFVMFLSVYLFWFYEQYTDIPLAVLSAGATIFLLQGFRREKSAWFLLAGFYAGLTCWTKLEGIFLNAWFLLTLLTGLRAMKPAAPDFKKKSFALYAAGVIIPASVFLFQKFFLAPEGEYWGSGRSMMQYVEAFLGDFPKTLLILNAYWRYMLQAHWNFLWAFFGAACLWRIIAARKYPGIFEPFGWIPFMLTFLTLLGYFFILHVTPYRIDMQIMTALHRLLLHASLMALIFTFETLLLPAWKKLS